MAVDTITENIDRVCINPQPNLPVPIGYIHYPISDEDMFELLDDLKDFGGLSPTDAAEALGYSAVAALINCPERGSIMGMVYYGELQAWGGVNLASRKSKDAYQNGFQIATKEWTK